MEPRVWEYSARYTSARYTSTSKEKHCMKTHYFVAEVKRFFKEVKWFKT